MNNIMEKTNERPKFEFTDHFREKFDKAMKLYQTALDQLNDAVHSSYDVDYGYCSNKYAVRLITPNDISTFTSNLVKSFRVGMLEYNIDDMQKFSVESVYRFLAEHGDTPFNDSDVLGAFSHQYVNPRDFMLTDLLVLAQNEVFPSDLKSNYEIGVQKMNIKEDLRKVNDLHFSGVMKNIVNALPRIIDKDPVWQLSQPLKASVFTRTLQSFIMFAITLNTITICGMKNYVIPKSSYSTKETFVDDVETDDDLIQESVDVKKNKPVFIVLSEGHTPLLSNTIRSTVNSKFSHASISFDPSLKEMWSYGRPSLNPDGTMNNVKFGFKSESIDERLFRGKHINIGVYAIFVPARSVKKMEEYIKGYLGVKTKFDWGAMIQQLFHKDEKVSDDKYTKICSTFVNTVLQQAGINITDKNSPNPGDIERSMESLDSKKVVKVFYGDSNDYSKKIADKKLKGFSKRKTSVTYESFVTECCLLKNTVNNFYTKIPFGCNIREIVLGDMTPTFHDTASSIYYIIKNPQSPIAQLLTKYVNLNTICDIPGASSIVPMLLKYKHDNIKQPGESWFNQKTGQRIYDDPYELNDFHTDVNWLDKIVYGDLFYDGNYRRDNPGNQAVHPILNTLDTIYHIYGDKHLSTNEELANHIINVGNVMMGIISAYKNNEIEDNQITKDILAVLGEILTRCILKLYHNNTIVVDNSDSMTDTMIPGYLYTESFVMEDADQQPNSGQAQNQNQNNTAKPTVNVVNRNNNTAQAKVKNMSMKASAAISALIRWINDQLRKAPIKFLEIHRLEISWVNANNKGLNAAIAQALDSKNFSITVNNYPAYNINIEKIRHIKTDVISQIADNINSTANGVDARDKTVNNKANLLFKSALPQDLQSKITPDMSDDQMKEAIQNWVLYDGQQPQQNQQQATPVTGKMFTDLCTNILESEKALQSLKPISDSLTKAADALKKRIDTTQQGTDQNNQNNQNNNNNQQQPQNPTNGLSDAQQALTKLANVYAAVVTNTISNKFYKESYSVYRDIVQAYNQEGTPAGNPTATTANNSQEGGNGNANK